MNPRGGYLLHDTRLLRGFSDNHTAGLDRAVSRADLRALNAIQDVPWRINQRVYAVAREVLDNHIPLSCLPPETLTVEVPDDATEEQERRLLGEAYRDKIVNRGRWNDIESKMAVAALCADKPLIWFPHSRDFRGRMYPIPASGPNPQSDDMGKALIEFGEAKPLGETGFYWLMVRIAGNAGNDKLSFDERFAWANEHLDLILAVAHDPLECRVWAEEFAGDEPWQFLASAFEIADALALDNPAAFLSRLPVPLDGTCNGLQHLAALGRDPVAGELVNLRAGSVRRDIYQEVANRVIEKLHAEAEATGDPLAMAWIPYVKRDTVKRGVMTLPYGVTFTGIRDQLVEDKKVPDVFKERKDKFEAATYLTKAITASLDEALVGPRSIMKWLQGCASARAKAGLPFEWTTPTGSRVRQSYYLRKRKRIETAVGVLSLADTSERKLDVRRQANGAAPNVIHSFDAAHLADTVNRCLDDGITSFAAIHDSFGVHACHAARAGTLLRASFAGIYRNNDWLANLYHGFAEGLEGVELPTPPETGSFDVLEVLDSDFFFS